MPRPAVHEAAARAHTERGIDPSFVITHTRRLDEAPAMYDTFPSKEDGCVKVVLKP